MKNDALLVYTLRPDNTSLWLPWALLRALGLKKGAKLTEEQFNDARVQELLAERRKGRPGE